MQVRERQRERHHKFIEALRTLEDAGDAAALAALFGDDATCDNLTDTDAQRGPDGARAFWEADRMLFESISSDFRNVVEDGDVVTLEWLRSGQARNGSSVRYAA